MKNSTSFGLGIFVGGLAVLAIAAGNNRFATWDYKVVNKEAPAYLYTEILNNAATNGWELVSSQIIPKDAQPSITSDGLIFMVLKHPKQ